MLTKMYTQFPSKTAFLALIALSAADQVHLASQYYQTRHANDDTQTGALGKDIASLESDHPDLAVSVFAWAQTQTAIATTALQSNLDSYFGALVSETTAPIPGYLTYLPAPLASAASEVLVSEASLLASDMHSGTKTVTSTNTNTNSVARTTAYMTTKMHMSGDRTAGTASTAGTTKSMNGTKPIATGPMVPPIFTTSAPKSASKSEAGCLGGLRVAVGVGSTGLMVVMLCL